MQEVKAIKLEDADQESDLRVEAKADQNLLKNSGKAEAEFSEKIKKK